MSDAAATIPRRPRALVVGLGSIDRGDDAVGPIVASRVRDALTDPGRSCVDVVIHEDPTALPEAMADVDVAVIVDAVRSGDEPGTVTLREAGPGAPALPARTASGFAATHGLGLAAIIELAGALELLPARVVVVGVEARDFGHGDPVSASVMGAVPHAVDAVIGILRDSQPSRP